MPVLGLGVSSDAVTWLGRPAAEQLQEQAGRAGLAVGDGPDVVTLSAGAVATTEALEAFVSASEAVQGDVIGRLRAPYHRWSEEAAFGAAARLVRLRGGGECTPERLAAATEVEVPVDGDTFDVPLLDEVGGRSETVHGSRAQLVSVHTFAGVVWANLLGLAPALIAALPGPRGLAPLRVAGAVLRARSVDPGEVGAQLVRRGRDVSVHPSAVVEGSWLMDGAHVDAGAIVRHSILGPGAVVEPQGLCLGSVLGPRARIQRRGFVTYGVLDADAVVGGTLQLACIGPSAQLKIGGLLLDQVLGGPVRVRQPDGSLAAAPLGVLGAALGRGAVVGARVTVAAGRVVPPDVTVIAGPSPILLRPEVQVAGRHRVVDGGLVPC